MKSENDILADYVRQNYPHIVNTTDYAFYRMGVRIGEATTAVIDGIRGAFSSTSDEECEEDETTEEEDENDSRGTDKGSTEE